MKKTLVPIVALGAISLMADYVLDFSHKVENTNTRDTRVITDVNINSKNFTLEAWVYRTANQNGYKIFAQYPNTTGNYSLFLGGYDSQSGTLDVFLRGATGWWRPGVALPLGVWRHVALTKDDAGTVTLYTNGVQAATMSDESLKDFYPNQPGRKLWIGNSYSDGFGTEGTYTVGFPGHLCEMRYWNVARTSAEIAAYWNRRLDGDETGLAGYWPLNEGGGDSVVNRKTGVASDVLGTGVWVRDSSMPFVNMRDIAFEAGTHVVTVTQNLSLGDIRYLPTTGAGVIVSGNVTGHGAVVVNSESTGGEVAFIGENDFSGGLTVTRGRFAASDRAAIGSGAIDIMKGTFAYTGTDAVTLTNAFYLRPGSGRNAILSNVGNLTLCGELSCDSNQGGFIKRGRGTLTIDHDAYLPFQDQYNGGLAFPENGDDAGDGKASAFTVVEGTLVVPAGRSLWTRRFYVGRQTTSTGTETEGHLIIRGAVTNNTVMLGCGNGTTTTASTPCESSITIDGGSLDAQWINTGSNPSNISGFNAKPKIDLNSGTITLTTRLKLGENGGQSTLNLNGGVLATPELVRGSGAGYVNFNGGVLMLTASPYTLSGLTRLSVLAGGAVFANDVDVTLGQTLTSEGADGGLVKKGTGTLTVTQANAYTGATRAEGGQVVFTHANGFPGGDIELAGGSVKFAATAYAGTVRASCAALASGTSFVEATGALDLTGATVVLSDPENLPAYKDVELVVFKAGAQITGKPALPGVDGWTCRLTQGGRALCMRRINGTTIIFK